MKRSKFSEAQIAFVLRQAEEGTSVEEVCRKTGISRALLCMEEEVRRLVHADLENGTNRALSGLRVPASNVKEVKLV